MNVTACPPEVFDPAEADLHQLVLAAQQGDRAAFGELFERFHQHIYAVLLRRCGDHNEAQELCQEVFVQAMTKIDQIREPACFGGWLRQIAVRKAINRASRKRFSVSAEPEVLENTYAEETTPLEVLIDGERASQVRLGLNRLREMDRETLVAFYVRGRTLLEMSDEFDAPVGTIKRRLHVARKRLAEQVEPMMAV